MRKSSIYAVERLNSHDDLFEALKLGRVKPEQAERRAQELGLPPLNPRSPMRPVDVMSENRWTIAMAFAWMITRDPERVRHVTAAWRAQIKEWREVEWQLGDEGKTGRGYVLFPIVFQDVLDEIEEEYSSPGFENPITSMQGALAVLWQALDNKLLIAECWQSLRCREIPAKHWRSMKYLDKSGVFHFFSGSGANRVEFGEHVVVRRSDILRLWPAFESQRPPSTLAPTKAAAVAEAVCQVARAAGDVWYTWRETERYEHVRKALVEAGFKTPPGRSTMQKALREAGLLPRSKKAKKSG